MSRRKKRRQESQSVAVTESKVAELQARRALIAEENAAKKLKFIEDTLRADDARRHIYEGFGFGGVSINGQTFVDRRDYMDLQFGLGNRYVLGSSTGFHQTTIQDRHLGRDEPWTVTQDDIAAARGMARLVTTINCPAVGIIENLENYTLKRGCNYVAGEKKNSKPPEGLIAAVQDVVDEFLDDNSWHCNRDREALTRSHVDGETFLGLYPQKNGFTKVRFIEPDQVVQPGMPPFTDLEVYQRWNVVVKHASNWELGIHTPDHDVEHVYGYCLQWDPSGPYDYMPAEHVVHFKRNVPANVKRGRTDFYPAWEWLLDEARLLRNTTSGAARLAAIAYIIQYATASKSEVEGMRRANADYEINLKSSSGTSKTLYREYEIPGERLEVPEGQEYQAGPMGAERGQAFLEVCNGILRNVAVRFCMTEGMVSGDDSSNNRASMAEAGSRFYNYIEGNQGRIGSFYESVIWKALLFAFRAGRFARFGFAPGGQRGWSDFKRVVQVAIEFPDIDPKQDLERTQKRQLLNGMRAMSIKTIQIQEKLDPEEESANFKEEMEQQMAQQQAMQGGMGGGLAGMLGGGMPPGGAPGLGGMEPPAPPAGGPPEAAPESPAAPTAAAPEPDPYAQPDAMGESRAVVQESGTRDGAVKGWDTRRLGGFNREEAERETVLLDKQIADLEARRSVMSSSLDKETSKPAIKANPGEVWVDDRSLHGRTVKIEDVNRKRREKTIGGLRAQIKDSDDLLEKLKQRQAQLQEAIERNQRDVEASRPQVDDAEAGAQMKGMLDDFAKSDEGQAFLKTLLGESAAVAKEGWVTLNAKSDEDGQGGGVRVFIGKDGEVAKGPRGLRGEKIPDAKGKSKPLGTLQASDKGTQKGAWPSNPGGGGKETTPQQGADATQASASLRGTKAIKEAVANWTPQQRMADWKKNKIRGASFKAWFGDWEHDRDSASKVVNKETGEPQDAEQISGAASVVTDEQGKPRAVYHGTGKGGWKAFDPNKRDATALYGPGYYFTEDRVIAKEYTEKGLEPQFLKGDAKQTGAIVRQRLTELAGSDSQAKALLRYGDDQLADFIGQDSAEGKVLQQTGVDVGDLYGDPNANPEVKRVYLNIRNPLDVDSEMPRDVLEKLQALNAASGGKYDLTQLRPESKNVYYALENGAGDKTRANEILRKAGFDGITHMGGGRWTAGSKPHRVWIAFEPTQIKATDNQGTFDESNPKLRESVQILHQGQVLFSGTEDQAVQILETGYAEYGAAAVQGIVIETAGGQRGLGESWLVESEETDEEGRWVTLKNGRRVFIAPGGMITKGLGTGQHVWNFGKQGPSEVHAGKHEPVTLEPSRTASQKKEPAGEHPIKRLTGKVKDAAQRFEKWLTGWFKSEDVTARRLLKRRAARAIRANVGLTTTMQAKRSVVRDMTQDFVDWVRSQYHDEREIEDVDRLLKARITSIAGESEAGRWEAAQLAFETSSEPVRLAVLEGTAQAIREYHQARG